MVFPIGTLFGNASRMPIGKPMEKRNSLYPSAYIGFPMEKQDLLYKFSSGEGGPNYRVGEIPSGSSWLMKSRVEVRG